MGEKYTVSEISRQTGDSPRQIQRKLKNLIDIDKGKYLVDSSIVDILYPSTTDGNLAATDGNSENDDLIYLKSKKHVDSLLELNVEFDVVEAYSLQEYNEFQRRLANYPILQKELEYHKKQMKVINDTLNKMATAAQSKNIIEAAEKGILPKGFKNE